MSSFKYLIIGNSAAGIAACEAIRQGDPSGQIGMISEEMAPIYSRSLISYYLAGQIDEEGMLFRPRSFYGREGIIAILGRSVVKIHADVGQVELEDGERIGYAKMLLATGSNALRPSIPGANMDGCFVFRNLEDAKAVQASLHGTKEAIVLGGGPVGIKVAEALTMRKIRVTMVISSGHLLSQILDANTSQVIHALMEQKGVRIIVNDDAEAIIGEGKVRGIRLRSGSELNCQMVIFCKGVNPRVELARGCGINVDKGIIVDDRMETSHLGIYAAGDVAEVKDILTGERTVHALWPNAMQQGHVAGTNMAGGKRPYDGGFGMNSINVFGTPVIAMGLLRPQQRGGAEVLTAQGKNWYRSLVLREGRIIGAVLLGEIESAGIINHLIVKKISISGLEDDALRPDFSPARLAEEGIEIELNE